MKMIYYNLKTLNELNTIKEKKHLEKEHHKKKINNKTNRQLELCIVGKIDFPEKLNYMMILELGNLSSEN